MRARRPIKHKTALAALIAASALAVSEPADVAAEGYAYGFAVNRPSIEDASAQALHDCAKETPGVDKRAQALCKVVVTVRDRCFAVAMDPDDATPGAGWAVADDRDGAERTALAKCQATAGDDRREFCKLSASVCDGTAK